MEFLKNIISYINPFDDKFLGKKIVELIGNLLQWLFVPEEGYFENLVSELESTIQEKIPYQTYVDSFNIIKDIVQGERAGLNVEISDYKIGETTISTGSHWIDFDFVLKHKQKWFSWCRGFTWIFFVIYNINQVIKLFSNRTILDGANKISEHSGGGNK